LIDAAVERRCERTGHCARTTGAWASEPALRALLGTALAPLSQGRIGTVEGRGDGREVLARHHLTDGVGPTKAPGLLGLCESGLSGRHGRSGKWAVEGAHRFPPGGIKKFIQHGTNGETLLIGTMGLRLKFCSFCYLSQPTRGLTAPSVGRGGGVRRGNCFLAPVPSGTAQFWGLPRPWKTSFLTIKQRVTE
jgi:hypothetical protein